MACRMMTKVARNVMSAPEVIRPDLPQPTKAGVGEQFILASEGVCFEFATHPSLPD